MNTEIWERNRHCYDPHREDRMKRQAAANERKRHEESLRAILERIKDTAGCNSLGPLYEMARDALGSLDGMKSSNAMLDTFLRV